MVAKRTLDFSVVSPSPAKKARTVAVAVVSKVASKHPVIKMARLTIKGGRRVGRGVRSLKRKGRSRGRRAGRKLNGMITTKGSRYDGIGVDGKAVLPSKTIRILDQDNTTIVNRTWSAIDLLKNTFSDTARMDRRESHVIQCSGFAHLGSWRNLTGNHVRVFQYWICPKQYDPLSFSTLSDTLLQDEWFNVTGAAEDQDKDWTDQLQYNDYLSPINIEKFIVLKKKSFMLGPGLAGAEISGMPSVRNEKYFVRLGKRFTYEQDSSEAADVRTRTEQPPVYWVSYCVTNGQGVAGTNGNVVQRQLRITTYFRDGASM